MWRVAFLVPALLIMATGMGLLAQSGSNQGAAVSADENIRLPADWLEGAVDRTRGITARERDGYYHTLARARMVDERKLAAAAGQLLAQAQEEFRSDPKHKNHRFSQFFDIATRPDWYRGRPVTLRGYIQRLETIEAGDNDDGLVELHQAYVFTTDSHPNPYVVVFTEPPAGIPRPTPGSPVNDIVVTGYFFKLWSYEAQHSTWAAPLVLAHRIEWHPRPPPLSSRTGFKIALGSGLALVAATIVLVIVWQRRADLRFRQRQRERFGSTPDDSRIDLSQLDARKESTDPLT